MKKRCESKLTKESGRIEAPPLVVEAGLPWNNSSGRPSGSAIFSAQAWEAIACSLKLSGRELQLVRGVVEGQKECTVAADLGISIHTIHTHSERLHQKLAVMNRSQLVQRIMQEFLVLTVSPQSLLPPICASQVTGCCPCAADWRQPRNLSGWKCVSPSTGHQFKCGSQHGSRA